MFNDIYTEIISPGAYVLVNAKSEIAYEIVF